MAAEGRPCAPTETSVPGMECPVIMVALGCRSFPVMLLLTMLEYHSINRRTPSPPKTLKTAISGPKAIAVSRVVAEKIFSVAVLRCLKHVIAVLQLQKDPAIVLPHKFFEMMNLPVKASPSCSERVFRRSEVFETASHLVVPRDAVSQGKLRCLIV